MTKLVDDAAYPMAVGAVGGLALIFGFKFSIRTLYRIATRGTPAPLPAPQTGPAAVDAAFAGVAHSAAQEVMSKLTFTNATLILRTFLTLHLVFDFLPGVVGGYGGFVMGGSYAQLHYLTDLAHLKNSSLSFEMKAK
jgi:hypothetical protein